jgi:hypothetical protein
MHLRNIPRPIWIVTVLIALVPGIWAGVALGQEHFIWFGATFGWAGLLIALFELFARISGDNPFAGLQLLAACGYLVALLGYSVCAYLAMRQTGVRRQGLLLVLLAAGISTVVSSGAYAVTLGVSQQRNLKEFFDGFLSVFPLYGLVLLHLLISAMLAWGIAVGLLRLSGHKTAR